MKLEKIDIEWTRGIVDTELDLGCDNFLISGRNGAGKSAVVDAIDLLVKGTISRLEGEGTGSISLKRHGAHIDAKGKKKDGVVVGTFCDKASGLTATVKRNLSDLSLLQIDGSGKDVCKRLLLATKDKQFILTRKQILQFIASPPKDRLEQVSALLNLTDVESVRASLQKIRNERRKVTEERQKTAKAALADLNREAVIVSGVFDAPAVLAKVNDLRKQLGGAAISDLFQGATSGIAEPGTRMGQPKVNWTVLGEDLSAIERVGEKEVTDDRAAHIGAASAKVAELGANPATAKAIRAYQLVELGEALLEPGSDTCPLCDKGWGYEELRVYLSEKRSLAVESQKALEVVKADLRSVLTQAATLHRSVSAVRNAVQSMVDAKDVEVLDGLLASLASIDREVNEGFASLCFSDALQARLTGLGISEDKAAVFQRIRGLIPKDEKTEIAKRERWDILSRIGKSLESYEKAEEGFASATADAKLAETVFERYQKARSNVLGGLYASIRDRFVSLYRMIHEEDEAAFQATMDPTEAGIELQVEFYGRGTHHPCAMHSEGHQDSMGLCLFLALVERLNADCFPIIVLDDVMTSVDDSHRKQLASMLKAQFSKWQFIVTTHEELWARQLRKFGMIEKKRHVEFYGWTVEGGPIHRELMDFLDKAQTAIDEERKDDAAFAIRNGLEAFYREACDAVGGSVTFQAAGDYDLGALLTPAVAKYAKLVDKGIEFSNAAGETEKADVLQTRKSALQEARKAFADENWILNPLVHYNEWASFSKGEVQALLNAHAALCDCLCCNECGKLLAVTRDGSRDVAVQCPCRKTSWFVNSS